MSEKIVDKEELLSHTASIVSSHVANNTVAVQDLPNLIESVFNTLSDLSRENKPTQERLKPAVPVKRSVTPDFLICLEDGKKLKMLKRHLKSQYGLTPEEYRLRWGLPSDYPMVAPNYANERRRLAKEIGLGRGRFAK